MVNHLEHKSSKIKDKQKKQSHIMSTNSNNQCSIIQVVDGGDVIDEYLQQLQQK